MIIVSIFSIVGSFTNAEYSKKELYSYNYTANLNYRVYLKNSQFFNTPYLGMNKQYISSLIDHIEVDNNYSFQSNKDLDYTYNYEIIATARGLYQNSDGKSIEVWSKTYPVANLESHSGTGKTFNINKTVNVDYNNYNQIMTDFRNQFGLSIDAKVDLTMKINILAGLSGQAEKTLQESPKMSLDIPLLQQTVNIKPSYVNSGGDTIYESTNATTKLNVKLLAFGITLLVVSLFALKKIVTSLLDVTKKSEYILAYNRIFKEYSDIIAETHNMPDLTKYDVVNVKTFNDLVDVEEELHSPIIAYEVQEDVECNFIILSNATAYQFTLRSSDFAHFNNN
jgi:hypothetical protein